MRKELQKFDSQHCASKRKVQKNCSYTVGGVGWGGVGWGGVGWGGVGWGGVGWGGGRLTKVSRHGAPDLRLTHPAPCLPISHVSLFCFWLRGPLTADEATGHKVEVVHLIWTIFRRLHFY